MATATELTLALGRTAYGGDPEDDEKIQSREVRVSVTWTLGEDEQDLPLAVSVLAEQAERALDQAERTAGKMVCKPATDGKLAPAPQTTTPETPKPETTKPGMPPGAETNGANGSALPAQTASGHGYGQTSGNGQNGGTGLPASRPGGYCAPPRKEGKQPGKAAPAAYAGKPDAITVPQRLAIHSLCTRMEVADLELSLLLDERFGKRRLEDLSKTEAGALLNALQRGVWEGETNIPAYAS